MSFGEGVGVFYAWVWARGRAVLARRMKVWLLNEGQLQRAEIPHGEMKLTHKKGGGGSLP